VWDVSSDHGRATGARGDGDRGDDASGDSVRGDGAASWPGETDASDAFQALGGEARVAVVRALANAPNGRLSFTALFEATDVETTAGFAYHLRQLDGRFVRGVGDGDDEAYALTDAGRRVARAIAAGAYTESVDRDPVALDDDCPRCGAESTLSATVADNVTTITCDACERDVLALPFPPGGYAAREAESVPEAVDRWHRRRIASYTDGVCPDCGALARSRVEAAGDVAADAGEESGDPTEHHRVRAAFACEACASSLSCPLSLTLLEHPAVVAAYHDAGVDVRDRPLWAVGRDWRERVLSADPWCVRATLESPDDGDDDEDDDRLAAYVGADATVVDVVDRPDGGVPRITATTGEDGAVDDGAGDDGSVDDGAPA